MVEAVSTQLVLMEFQNERCLEAVFPVYHLRDHAEFTVVEEARSADLPALAVDLDAGGQAEEDRWCVL